MNAGPDPHSTIPLVPDHAKMLAALGMGLSVDDTGKVMERDRSTIGRWRQDLEDDFGTPNMLQILVRTIHDGTVVMTKYRDAFGQAASEQYRRTLKALGKPGALSDDDIVTLLAGISQYPHTGRLWVSNSYTREALAIMRKADIRPAHAGSFALIVGAAAELKLLHWENIPPPKTAVARISRGGVDMTFRGKPGKVIQATFEIDTRVYEERIIIPGA